MNIVNLTKLNLFMADNCQKYKTISTPKGIGCSEEQYLSTKNSLDPSNASRD